MNVWDKTEIEFGKENIDKLFNEKNHKPIKIITSNNFVKKQLVSYMQKYYTYITDFELNDYLQGRKDNKKIYQIYTRRELNSFFTLMRKKDSLNVDLLNHTKLKLANLQTINLKELSKIRLRSITGWNTGLLA